MIKAYIKNYKNLFLFLLLIVAIGATYIFEEEGNKIAASLESKRTQVLDTEHLGELKGIRGIKIDIEKKGEKYYSRDNQILLATPRLDEMFKILAGLKVKTFLKDEDVARVGRSFYIPDEALKLTFQFEKG